MEWEEIGGDQTPTEQPNTPNEGENNGENENEEDNNNEDNTPSDGGNSNEGGEENNEGGEETPSTGDENQDQNEEGNGDEGNGGNNIEPAPDADLSITAWSGEWATDSGKDAVGSDKDFFYEQNTFNNRVTVTYNGSTASVENNNSSIKSYITGA